MDYKEAYEKEHIKCADLAGRVADLEEANEELQFKLNRIKNNPLWKVAKPLRNAMHFVIRQKDRIVNCGGFRGILAKIDYKKRERQAMKNYGTASFPTPEEVKRQRNVKFDKAVKISILVPLYNTPKEFLKEMIDSVLYQTYENWELCLADGSDAEHAYVGEICQEYVSQDEVRDMEQSGRSGIPVLYIISLPKTREFPGIPMSAINWQPENILGCLTMMIYCIPRCCLNM